MALIRHSASPRGVTFFHVAPPSRVTCTTPSSLPVQITPFSCGDSAIYANAVDYGLTAGLYSQDPAEINQFLDTIEAGVIYVNRFSGATTGAWPGFQPFGGWKGSSTTGKGSGGEHYLQQYMREQAQTALAPADAMAGA